MTVWGIAEVDGKGTKFGCGGVEGVEKTAPVQVVSRSQFKCRKCDKVVYCYGSRYCQNEFNPVSLVTVRTNTVNTNESRQTGTQP